MRKIIGIALATASLAVPAFAADMPVKAPPAPPASADSWTGPYLGFEVGYGWNNNAVNLSPNDPAAADLLAGNLPLGGVPVVSAYTLRPSGAVGGIEAGYNWQSGPNWLLGLEADFSFAGLSGQAAGSSVLAPGAATQTVTVQQTTDWYGTVRGRLGWLATPSLLIFGTGGLAYGRVTELANYAFSSGVIGGFGRGAGTSFFCNANTPCFSGSSTTTRIGWTAGGGAEFRVSPHVSLKAEYQVVDLGTQSARVTAHTAANPGDTPSSFNAAFRDQIQIVRVGLNWHL